MNQIGLAFSSLKTKAFTLWFTAQKSTSDETDRSEREIERQREREREMPMQMDVQTNPVIGFRVNPGELELGIRMMRAGSP